MSETRTVSPTLEQRLVAVFCAAGYHNHQRLGYCNASEMQAVAILAAAKEHGLVIGEGELDAAWKEAEEALPEGGELFLSSDVLNPPERRYEVEAAARILKEGPTADDWKFSANFQAQGADGPTPAAALQALAAKLRDSRR